MAGNGPECNTDKDHDCRSARVVYKAVCINCETAGQETQYIGTSGRSLHSRTVEHMALINSRSNGNAQSRHNWDAHPNLNPNFRRQLIRGGIHFNVERFIHESLEIEDARSNNDIQLLNQRSEWGQRGLVRLAATQ